MNIKESQQHVPFLLCINLSKHLYAEFMNTRDIKLFTNLNEPKEIQKLSKFECYYHFLMASLQVLKLRKIK